MGAFGLNASMMDSANLAWKLGLCARNLADLSALAATYDQERRQHAQQIIRISGSYLRFVCQSTIPLAEFEHGGEPLGTAGPVDYSPGKDLDFLRQFFGRRESELRKEMLDVNYRGTFMVFLVFTWFFRFGRVHFVLLGRRRSCDGTAHLISRKYECTVLFMYIILQCVKHRAVSSLQPYLPTLLLLPQPTKLIINTRSAEISSPS